MNILYENLHADSIAEIVTGDARTSPSISKRCEKCRTETSHEEIEKAYFLPDVLIVNLKRFNQIGKKIRKDCREVEPSTILQKDEIVYSLNAVVTHFGRTTQDGHYIASLSRNGQWIHCNDDKVISEPNNDVPDMGYLFFYDQVREIPLALPSVSTNVHEHGASTSHSSQSFAEQSPLQKEFVQSRHGNQISGGSL